MPRLCLGPVALVNRRVVKIHTVMGEVIPTATPTQTPTQTPTETQTEIENIIPDASTSLQVWYDGADESTFVPSATDELGITQWTDKSNFAQNANPTGGASERPTYENTILQNGNGYLEFDGGDALSVNPFSDLASATNFSAFVVARCTDLTEGRCLITTQAGDFRLVINSTTTNVGMNGLNNFGSASTSNNLNNWYLYTMLFDGSQATNETRLIARRNKINLFDSGSFTGTIPSSFASTSNTTMFIGQRADGTGKLMGNIAEIILFSRTLNSAEYSDVENYLTNKWALNN